MVAVIFAGVFIGLMVFGNVVYAKGFGATLCENSLYSCHVVKRGESWQKLFPDSEQRDKVMRINRMNTGVYPGLTIAIPKSITTDYLHFSPLPTHIDPPGRKVIIVSINDLAFGAYNADGTLAHWGPISAGKGFCSDIHRRCGTPAGKFAIYAKQGSGCVSRKFPVGRGGAPMPYCMFFHGGFALHGSPKVPGYHDSHGCVRLFTNDAKWLNQDFDEGGTRVIIKR